ncbi:MAG: 16S rRNA processing protein RimM [Alphaproteobacteria bacterium]|nr:16S rRNA processing protein RimM [Alphaproteobacteria bacterium]OJV45372.1 MAG: 16S rRNA processing protein RimM [Alphaproteobacteria bacterium 43-37]
MGLVCVGKIVGVKGIKGLLKVKSYTQHPQNIAQFGTLLTESGMALTCLHVQESHPPYLVISCDEITDRTQAEKLKGQNLSIHRHELPQIPEDEYYYVDLIGLDAIDRAGEKVGIIKQVANFGGGDFLEIDLDAGQGVATILFSREDVPVVNIKGRHVIIERESLLIANDKNNKAMEGEE